MKASVMILSPGRAATAQSIDVTRRLQSFDEYMAKTLKDWNGPGVGVGVVVGDKLMFAKAYGFHATIGLPSGVWFGERPAEQLSVRVESKIPPPVETVLIP